MSSHDQSVVYGLVKPQNTFHLLAYVVALYAGYHITTALYIAFFGPLSKYPGPLLCKFSRLPLSYWTAQGKDGVVMSALHEKYGPVVRVASDELSLIGTSQSWNDVYGFKKPGQPKPIKDPQFYATPKALDLGGVSIFVAGDEDHSRQRRILSHAFSDSALREQEPLLKGWAAKMKEKMTERAADGQKLDMVKAYNCTTFDVMADLTFAEHLDMLEGGEYSPWVKVIFDNIKAATFIRLVRYFPTVNRLMDAAIDKKKRYEMGLRHQSYVADRVDRRLAKTPDRPDLWSRILAKGEPPSGLNKAEQYLNASGFMVAGTETTATALSGVTYYLTMNPELMKKVTDEIRSNFSSLEDLTLESLARLKYMNACLKEGLRMYPPVPVALPRAAPSGGATVNGEWVPEGTRMGVHQYATYRSSKNFNNPNTFAPERWLGTDPQYENDNTAALEPFSVGPRNCIGKNLAWHEMRLLLATTLLNFDIELTPESRDWNQQNIFTLWEKRPLWCKLTPVSKKA